LSFIGDNPSSVCSNSESELNNAFKSVLANPSVTRRNVTFECERSCDGIFD
jgi:hypothetical protein